MTQQGGDPLAVQDIGLAAWDGFHVLGVDQDDLTSGLQDVEDGPPIDARRLHRDMADLVLSQPIRKLQEVDGSGGKGTHLATDLATLPRRDDAGHHRLLVHIQTGATRIQDHQIIDVTRLCTHCLWPPFLVYLLRKRRKKAASGASEGHKVPPRARGWPRGDTRVYWKDAPGSA